MTPPKIKQAPIRLTEWQHPESYYKRECLRYQGLYNTMLAENRCYRRRMAALRRSFDRMRAETSKKGRKAVSEG